MGGWVVLGAIALLVVMVVGMYNGLVKKRNLMEEGWSGIDVQLKRRHNLIPNLVNTVKGYAAHEQETLDRVTEMRAKATSSDTTSGRAKAEGAISSMLGGILAIAENYPDLKASENFNNLQDELASIEGEISLSRRYYNGAVRDLNVAVQSFPSNLIANFFGFKEGEFFEIELATQREVPEVKF